MTLNWIAEKVNNDMPGFNEEPAVLQGTQTDDIFALEAEAMEKGDSDGPETALGWLQSRPGMDSPRSRWLLRLLMARVAEQYGRNELALHLLGEHIQHANTYPRTAQPCTSTSTSHSVLLALHKRSRTNRQRVGSVKAAPYKP